MIKSVLSRKKWSFVIFFFRNNNVFLQESRGSKIIHHKECSYFDSLSRILPIFGGIITYLYKRIAHLKDIVCKVFFTSNCRNINCLCGRYLPIYLYIYMYLREKNTHLKKQQREKFIFEQTNTSFGEVRVYFCKKEKYMRHLKITSQGKIPYFCSHSQNFSSVDTNFCRY